ncbi:MAG: alkaline phosphatase D family protein [Acidimicrobiales bacterium]|nr:alkaline phosphatase D family protein [Acidimicrobiales bacterium]
MAGSPLTRRSFLIVTASGIIAACSGDATSAPPVTTASTTSAAPTTTASTLPPGPSFAADPFSLGVASGDPASDSVVLWTRLATDPFAPDGGMTPEAVTIGWQVGADENMSDIVASGNAVADPAFGHSVHIELAGLEPARTYWYRFFVGDWETETARTRTTPAAGDLADRLVLGHISCQRITQGYWTAFDDLATHDVDAIVHCGDYIYERNGSGIRTLDIPEPTELAGYRAIYAGYKADPSLQAAHAIAPWVVTWDDHEVENNYQGQVAENGSDTPDRESFLARRGAAYQAWWENMPVRLAAPVGASLPIHRGVEFGRLVSLSVLDTRQYRTDQACAANDVGPRCEGSDGPDFTVLGAEQEAWLSDRLAASDAVYNVLQQQVVMQQWRLLPGDAAWNLDQWDGYPAARDRLFDDLRSPDVRNPVVLTGDVHSSWVGSLATDFDDENAEVIGTEFVGTSVSSDGSLLEPIIPAVLEQNPHLEWAQATRRGWTRHEITPTEWRADFREVEDATVPGTAVEVATSWVLPDGGTVERI